MAGGPVGNIDSNAERPWLVCMPAHWPSQAASITHQCHVCGEGVWVSLAMAPAAISGEAVPVCLVCMAKHVAEHPDETHSVESHPYLRETYSDKMQLLLGNLLMKTLKNLPKKET